MKESALTTVVLPLALFLIMLGMGLGLTPRDFHRVLKVPKAALVGLACQLVALPPVALGLITAFDMSGPLAVGVMIIAVCPGGVTSNLITHVSKGDTALSITLTALSSFITVFTIPLILSWALAAFATGPSSPIELPLLQTILQVFAITILPVSIGMGIRHKRPDFAQAMDRPSRIASTLIFVVLVAAIILKERQLILDHFGDLAGVTITLNLVTMALGFLAGWAAGLPGRQVRTIAIESGVQNGTLAIVIATSILAQPEMALPGGIYSLVMFGSAGIMMALGSRMGGV